MIHIHNSNLLRMNHIFMEWQLKKKKNFNLTINSFFENSKSAILFKKKTFLEKF